MTIEENIYIKDFDWRNSLKKNINISFKPYIKHWEIWLCRIWTNVWSEIDWKSGYLRPVIVVAVVGSMYFVAPMTTKKHKWRFYHKI